jgi:hypothetical protein
VETRLREVQWAVRNLMMVQVGEPYTGRPAHVLRQTESAKEAGCLVHRVKERSLWWYHRQRSKEESARRHGENAHDT